MKISVIIVNYNVKYFLEVCLHSVQRALEGIPSEIIVVDNNSKDGSCDLVRKQFPSVCLIENRENQGFSKANNQAADIAQGAFILFLNPDTVMPEDFCRKMLAYMEAHPEAGAIGPRLIDGKGRYAPDGKKSFPSLSVAIFKTSGIHKLFPKSPYFNKYYAAHVGEYETAEVDILSGCCMMVRSSMLQELGHVFDEDYFMYCEDFDLCYRIHRAGYKNIYFPEVHLIHYKGESTRKASLSYVRIFNDALLTFVRKNYSKPNARWFLLFINFGIMLRAILGVARQVLRILRLPLLDAVLLFVSLYFLMEFWIREVKNIPEIPLRSIYLTYPVYILIWILSLFLNGAYDQPYRVLRVVRGMLVGTVLCLAYFGLLSPELRHSRAVIVFTGTMGAVLLVALHELFFRLGIIKTNSSEDGPRKAVLVADEPVFHQAAQLLSRFFYAPEVYGRISSDQGAGQSALAKVEQMKPLLFTAGINEVIFCVNGLSYATILDTMQTCGPSYNYKIHLPGSQSFVGSNSSQNAGDLYTMDQRYNLSRFHQRRNKRMVDIFLGVLGILCSPVLVFLVYKPVKFLVNCFRVIWGSRSWVGYAGVERVDNQLPEIRRGLLPPYHILEEFRPPEKLKARLNTLYAQNYTSGADLGFILKNFRYLGGFSEKDFAEKES
jgi:O-antigen biosynthesis protein